MVGNDKKKVGGSGMDVVSIVILRENLDSRKKRMEEIREAYLAG